MNAPAPPVTNPAAVQEKKVETTLTSDTTMMTIASLVSLLFTIAFFSGAAYLSYQRNQSFAWAVFHFFVAGIYYPYYAFTQPSTPAPVTPIVQTAGRRMMKRK